MPYPDLWSRVSSAFADIIDRPDSEWNAAILEVSRDSPDLAQPLRELLAEHTRTGDFLQSSPLLLDEQMASREIYTFGPNDRLADRFRIVRPLGLGGMGEVYEATDERLRHNVAIKALRPAGFQDSEVSERFRIEVLRARQITHPNVCRVYELFSHSMDDAVEVPFFTMELLQGETLSDWLIHHGPCSGDEAVFLLHQIAVALDAAHRAGIVHRDLKPSNVFVSPIADGSLHALVTDFGIASETGSDLLGALDDVQATENSLLAGTPAYMSPEQLLGRPSTAATDVYALGLLAYELRTGKRAYKGTSALSCAIQKLADNDFRFLEEDANLPVSWTTAIKRCLQFDPAIRFATASEFLDAITVVTRRSPRRFATLTATTATIALALGSATAYQIHRASSNELTSVAVLPFRGLEGNHQATYFSEGVSDEIGQALTLYPQLRVAAQTAASRFRDSSLSPKKIAEELHVNTLLLGSSSQSNGRIHLRVQLVDGTSERQLWSQIYDRDVREIFLLQQELVTELASRLDVGKPSAMPKAHLVSAVAHDAFLQGRYVASTRTQEGLIKGLEHFRQALAIDPQFVSAQTATASAYISLIDYGWASPKDAAPKVREALSRALETDPDSADTQSTLGYFNNLFEWDQAGAERAFQKALVLSPSSLTAHLWYGNFLMRAGRLDQALREMGKAAELDTLSPSTLLAEGWVRYYLKEYSRSIEICRRAIDKDPSIPHPYQLIALNYARLGNAREAIAANALAVERTPDQAVALRHRAWVRSLLKGYEREAAEAARVMVKVAPGRQTGFLAVIYAGLGDRENMYRWAQAAVEAHDSVFLIAGIDPAFDAYREETKFMELVRSTGYKN